MINKIGFAELHFVPVRALTSLRATPFVAKLIFKSGFYNRKMMKTKFVICSAMLLLLISTAVALNAQDSTACRAAIRKAFGVLQNTEALMKNGVFIGYKTQMCTEQDESQCWADSARLIMKGKKSALLSHRKKIFRDDTTQVVILDDRKQIVITAMKIIDKEKAPHLDFAGIQDTLLLTSGYIDCALAITGADTCYSATLLVPRKIRELTGVEKVHYLVNHTQGVMKQIGLWYTSGKPVKRAVFDIKKADYTYGKEPFTGAAIQQVFDSQGHLLKVWEGYQVVDLRNK